jgi:hypothetical protein
MSIRDSIGTRVLAKGSMEIDKQAVRVLSDYQAQKLSAVGTHGTGVAGT